MKALLSPRQRAFLATVGLALLSAQVPSCGGSSNSGPSETGSVGGSTAGANTTSMTVSGGTSVTGGTAGIGGSSGVATTGGNGLASGGTTAGASTSTGASGGTLTNAGGAASGGAKGLGGSANGTRGTKGSGGFTGAGGKATGGTSATGGATPPTGGSSASTGGNSSTGGVNAVGGATGGSPTGGSSSGYLVSLIQSSKADAGDITESDIVSMVTDAVTQAGGLDFIRNGMTVVLKPNLLTHLQQCWFGSATNPATINGVTTDWRVTKAVADLVRAKNPTGKVLVMEGSARSTTAAYTALGYTSANFGSSVDEFIALEGSACGNNDSAGLVEKAGRSGTQYWINQRYFEADVVISIPALKTHSQAGITGAVKNLGIGSTPAAKYSASTSASDCGRNQSNSSASSYIEHTLNGLGSFVSDFYSIRPADFAVMDGLQGLQNGPCSSSSADRMNMRLVMASKNAVALDTVQAAVMNCTGSKVPHLTKLEGWGLGTTDMTKISVVGNKQVADVKKAFKGGATGVCN